MIIRRDLFCDKRYLNMPVQNGARVRRLRVLVNGKCVAEGSVEVAEGVPDFWTFIDLEAQQGKEAQLELAELPFGSRLLESFELGDEIKGAWPVGEEPRRPLYHFTPRRGWINDPNGLVWFRGEYHLFFQHNPYGLTGVWGGMHWGHAVSTDLVHWRELGEALAPDEFGAMCSGSAVVDHDNSSGLGTDGRVPLLLFYTAAKEEAFVQGMAYSLDGRTFRKYERNPVVPQIRWGNRDPKVFRHAESGRWVMAISTPGEPELARDEAGRPFFRHEVHFLTSANLRDWKPASILSGGFGNDFVGIDRFLYECIDLFCLPVDGEVARSKWVISAANGSYAVGQFDGEKFVADDEARGRAHPDLFYAAQTFNDAPNSRCVQMGFLRTLEPGMPFRQNLSVPMELSLRTTDEGVRLFYTPVPELEALRMQTHIVPDGPLPAGRNALADLHLEAFDLELEIEPGTARWICLEVGGAPLVYDVARGELVGPTARAPLPLDRDGRLVLRALGDRSCCEIFAGHGRLYFPIAVPPSPRAGDLSLSVTGGTAIIRRLVVHEMGQAVKSKIGQTS
jgi:sucrose-6-phosphate hydrolase SacC (GH32 family)